jgi:hypothetical protein
VVGLGVAAGAPHPTVSSRSTNVAKRSVEVTARPAS